MSNTIKVHADGFGTWHARIAVQAGDTTDLRTLKRRASMAIRTELLERGMDASACVSVYYVGMTSNPNGGFYENFKEV